MNHTYPEQRTKKSLLILLADDDADGRVLAREALRESKLNVELSTVENGEELLNYLLHKNLYADKIKFPDPDIILLDLNMPRIDGRQALHEIKTNTQLKHIPVVMLTTSTAAEDIAHTYKLGVNSYIAKPINFHSLVNVMKTLCNYWFDVVELPSK